MNSPSREKQEDEMKKKILFALFVCGMLVTLFTTVCLPAMAVIPPTSEMPKEYETNCPTCKQTQTYKLVKIVNFNDSWHVGKLECPGCGAQMNLPSMLQAHSGGTATCTEKAVCSVCKAAYGSPLEHDWSEWKSNGNGEHTRTCKRDGSHTQTDSCSGGTATCIAKAVCTTCGAEYGEIAPDNHDIVNHDAKAPTCLGKGWNAYKTCKRCNYSTTYQELPALGHDPLTHEAKAPTCTDAGWKAYYTCKRCNFTSPIEPLLPLGHDPVQHDAKAATCTEVGWNAYETCKRCNYTTYSELPIDLNNHDLVHHEAQVPTCTEIGWNEYDACTRCKYTTYSELSIDPDNHDLVHHEAKTPTCTEIGWNEYDTCTRCDYTTYVELPALGHDYQKTVVQPTCEKGGYTRYTCSRCEDTYTENPVKKLLHWYGEWSPNGDNTHSADCRRDGCRHTGKAECETFEYRLLFADAEDYAFELCPVCGEVSDGARLELVMEAAAKAEHLPQGELVLRLNELQNGERILSVGFEYSGKLTQPAEPVEINIPAELLEGYTLYILAADGAETELPFTVTEDTATFTLNFDAQDEIPVRTLHLIPIQ